MTMVVTGANGFVGRAVLHRLSEMDAGTVRVAVRRREAAQGLLPGADVYAVGDLSGDTEWRNALTGVDTVIHLAARVHLLHDDAADQVAAYTRVNVDATRRLAQQAADNGVRRVVFLSTLKVHGEEGHFRESDMSDPFDPYARSKWAAELELQRIARETGLEVTVIRPPLVHGPGARGNLRTLIRAIDRGIPLPLGSVDNRRSLVGVDNLADLIVRCVSNPAAAGETFLVSDGADVSTPELIRGLASAMRRPVRLVHVPPAILLNAARMVGKGAAARRLLGSLTVDIAKARTMLGWTPPVSVTEGFRRAVGSA